MKLMENLSQDVPEIVESIGELQAAFSGVRDAFEKIGQGAAELGNKLSFDLEQFRMGLAVIQDGVLALSGTMDPYYRRVAPRADRAGTGGERFRLDKTGLGFCRKRS